MERFIALNDSGAISDWLPVNANNALAFLPFGR
jgi:hypothetical protein